MIKKKKTYFPSEREIQKQIVDYLKSKNIFHWCNNVGRKHNLQFGLKGSGDIMGITSGGIFFSIECKDHKGKMSLDQILFEKKINDNSGIYILARSLDDVTDIL